MIVIGIDPGVKGGIAIIPVYAFRDTRTFDKEKMTLGDVADILREYRKEDALVEVYLENPNLPQFNFNNKGKGFNLAAHHKLSRSVGQYEGICYSFGYIPTLISPIKWQNALNCRTMGDKKVSRTYAQNAFPFLKRLLKNGEMKSTVTHNVADALLIALYGYLKYAKPQYVPRSVQETLQKGGQNARSNQSTTVPYGYGPRHTNSMRRLPPRSHSSTRAV